MNAMHLHLILNHIPVLGVFFGFALMLSAFGRKSEELKKAALAVFVVTALLAVPAYLTGEPSEAGIKGLPGVSMAIAEKHEEAAGITFVLLLVLGVSGLASLFWFRSGKVIPVWLNSSFLVASLLAVASASWTANLGGQVRHSEIRSAAIAPSGAEENSQKSDD